MTLMVRMHYWNIPVYLRAGQFYRDLDSSDPNRKIELSWDCFQINGDEGETLFEFCRLIRVMQYWELDELPYGIHRFSASNPVKVWKDAVIEAFGPECADELEKSLVNVKIKYRDIPMHLQIGDFFRSLGSGDPDDIIVVPRTCFHPNGEEAEDVEEFRQLLSVMVFWMLDEIPLGVLRFCDEHAVNLWNNSITEFPESVAADVRPVLIAAFAHSSESLPIREIIQTGRWDLIKYALGNLKKSSGTAAIAAEFGNLQLLKYVREEGFVLNSAVCPLASRGGHLECLIYAHENGSSWDVDVHTLAAQNGHLQCMQYAYEQGLEWHADVCMYAAAAGHLHCLRYAHENGCPWNSDAAAFAAQEGQFICLQYLRDNGCAWDIQVFQYAAGCGHLKCIHYARSQGLDWDSTVCARAATSGQIKVLQYLCENGCPWDVLTTETAAEKGHTDCLLYALEHECSVNEQAMLLASEGGHIDCIHILRVFGVDWSEKTTDWSAKNLSAECLKYLHENGCPWDDSTTTTAAWKGEIEPLKYSLEQGCPYDDNIVEYGALNCNLDCIKYLVEDQGHYMSSSVFMEALLRGDLSCLTYLIDQGCSYIDLAFEDSTEQVAVYDYVFRHDNPEFVRCVEYAVERGWPICKIFIQYIVARDEPCKEWLQKEGYYANE